MAAGAVSLSPVSAPLSPAPAYPHIPGGEGVSYGRIGNGKKETPRWWGQPGQPAAGPGDWLGSGRPDAGSAGLASLRSFFRCRGER